MAIKSKSERISILTVYRSSNNIIGGSAAVSHSTQSVRRQQQTTQSAGNNRSTNHLGLGGSLYAYIFLHREYPVTIGAIE